jgi:hypothetical protein
MNKNIIFEKWGKKDNYFIIIYWVNNFHLSINYHKGLESLEISLGKINIVIGFPYKNE